MPGPLSGLRVVEFAGIGPGPFCAMVLSDLGAEVVRVARPGATPDRTDVLARGRLLVELDLRAQGTTEQALQLLERADVLIEGFRPGVMERLGLGPKICHARNQRLVYGRMTGWGQSGPLSQAAGHDINYLAISGALHAIGRAGQPPVVPLNYVADFGGGGMLLAMGLLSALYETGRSGLGQVVDAAMTDGAALLSAMMYGFRAAGQWTNGREENMLDGGAFFYSTYECADGRFVAIGPIEPQFYAAFLDRCGLIGDPDFAYQMDKASWPARKRRLTEVFRTRTRDQWCELLEGSDACFAPVLDWDDAPRHGHNVARRTFVTLDGVVQPAPAPRFDRTPAADPASIRTASLVDVLSNWATPLRWPA